MPLLTPAAPRIFRVLLPGLVVGASLSLFSAACSDSTSPEPQPYPVVWAWSDTGQVTVNLRYIVPLFAPDCAADSVWVTGPHLAGEVALRCEAARGAAFFAELDSIIPSIPPPLVYNFRARIRGKTVNQTAEVNCYQPLPIGIAPPEGDTVTSPVTLRWLIASALGIQYAVYVSPGFPPGEPAGVATDKDSLRLTLGPGTYYWAVEADPLVGFLEDGTAERTCGAFWESGSFTVQ